MLCYIYSCSTITFLQSSCEILFMLFVWFAIIFPCSMKIFKKLRAWFGNISMNFQINCLTTCMFLQCLLNKKPVTCFTILKITSQPINEFEKIICKLWKSFWTNLWELNCRATVTCFSTSFLCSVWRQSLLNKETSLTMTVISWLMKNSWIS